MCSLQSPNSYSLILCRMRLTLGLGLECTPWQGKLACVVGQRDNDATNEAVLRNPFTDPESVVGERSLSHLMLTHGALSSKAGKAHRQRGAGSWRGRMERSSLGSQGKHTLFGSVQSGAGSKCRAGSHLSNLINGNEERGLKVTRECALGFGQT